MTHPAFLLANHAERLPSQTDTPFDVRSTFQERFGTHNYQLGASLAGFRPLVAGGLLHFDDFPSVQPVQIVVAEKATQRYGRHSRPRHPLTGPYDYYGYESADFIVATADDSTIHVWDVQTAGGIHPGLVNGITNCYDFHRQTVHLDITHPDMPAAHIEVSRQDGHGSVRLGQVFAWIIAGSQSAA